jgi:hypothetical protein
MDLHLTAMRTSDTPYSLTKPGSFGSQLQGSFESWCPHLGLTQGATVQLVPVGAQEASYTSLECRYIHISGTSGTRELVSGCLAIDITGYNWT